jgi:hypothetical protein
MSSSGLLHNFPAKIVLKALSAIADKGDFPRMKKLMIATLSLGLLSGTAIFAAQNTSTDTSTTKAKKHKKSKKSTTTDTMAPAPK